MEMDSAGWFCAPAAAASENAPGSNVKTRAETCLRKVVLQPDPPQLGIDQAFARMQPMLPVDQMAALAPSLADCAYVLASGRVVAECTAQSLLADGSLTRAYLGEGAG